MEGLIDQFHSIVKDFRLKRHDLLAYHNNKFDRDYVEFNVKISDLECSLQASLLARFLCFCLFLYIGDCNTWLRSRPPLDVAFRDVENLFVFRRELPRWPFPI